MNVLVDRFPTSVEIDGKSYELNTDFRTCLKIILAFEDNDLCAAEKYAVMLNNLYKELPKNTKKAVVEAIKFLDKGNSSDEQETPIRLFSYNQDADFIFAAFRQTHGIDLEISEMHWWKFVTLFMDIGSDTVFSNLVSLRKRIKTGRATKEERKLARELGDMFELEKIDNRTIKEKEAERIFLEKVARSKELEYASKK